MGAKAQNRGFGDSVTRVDAKNPQQTTKKDLSLAYGGVPSSCAAGNNSDGGNTYAVSQ